jgi:hypothetical protein
MMEAMQRLLLLVWVASLPGACVRTPTATPACACEAACSHDLSRAEVHPVDRGGDRPPLDGARDASPDARVNHYLRFSGAADFARFDGLQSGADFSVSLKLRLTSIPAAFKDYITCFDYDPPTGTLSGWELGFEASAKPRWWMVNHDKDPWPNLCNVAATGSLSTGTWYQMVFTLHYTSSSTINVLYVDGIAVAQGTASTCQQTMVPGPLPTGALRLGGMDGVSLDADDFRVFDRALTLAEVNALRAGQIPSGVVVYWDMDEGSGTTLHDASGKGHDGTLYASSWQVY